jgi:hypothetical protein
LSSFEVDGVGISGSGRNVGAKRVGGRWRLIRPYKALLDPGKMEGVLATLAGLRIAGGDKGFAADDVRDFAPFGLDAPRWTFELDPGPSPGAGKPQVVEIGKDVPDKPGHAYARRADQNDVVVVETKNLQDLGADPKVLRSQRIADLDTEMIPYIELQINGQEHALARGPDGWQVLRPSAGRADDAAVRDLLNHLNEKIPEFLDPEKVPNADLEKPWAVIKVWQMERKEPGKTEPLTSLPKEEPTLTLRLGRVNLLGKVVYAQTDNAPSVLLVPDSLLKVLPDGPLGYRDRSMLALNPADVTGLTVHRDGKTFEVSGTSGPGHFEQWKMNKPVAGPADAATVAQLVVMLANLRAESLVAESPESLSRFGLDAPLLSATLASSRPAAVNAAVGKGAPATEVTLSVGGPVPGKAGSHYARLSSSPIVFTIGPIAMQLLGSELRERRVLGFDPLKVDGLTLRWPDRTLALARKPNPAGGDPEWVEQKGSDSAAVPSSQINSLVGALAGLAAVRFTQYAGPIPADTGLAPPLVTIEVHLANQDPTHSLGLGKLLPGNLRLATTATGPEGPVFALAEADWTAWATRSSKEAPKELPAEVFEKSKPKP